jgi:hypothetical protein
MEDVWLQYDEALAHFTLTVCDILNKQYPGHWIAHGSQTSLTPLSWPPYRPDLTLDNHLWGTVKAQMTVHRYHNNELYKELWNT